MNPAGENQQITVSGNFLSIKLKWREVKKILKKLRKDCKMSLARLRRISNSIEAEMTTALSEYDTMIKIQPAFIRFDGPLPTEPIKYFGLYYDGATKLIAASITREPSGLTSVAFRFSIKINSLELDAKCDEIAGWVHMLRIHEAPLMTYEKVGVISDNVDEAALEHGLQTAFDNKGQNYKVFTIRDETLLGLCSYRADEPRTFAAVNVGTNTHAAYVERVDWISNHPELNMGIGEMVVLVDWNNFNSEDLPITEYDASIDAESSNPNQMVFKKLVSGKYMGEVVRKVILQMLMKVDRNFRSELLATPFSLRYEDVVEINKDYSPDFEMVSNVFAEVFQITEVPFELRKGVAKACDIISKRCASLNAAAIAGIIKRYGFDRATGKVVGLCYPTWNYRYTSCVKKTVSDIVGNATNIRLQLVFHDVPVATAFAVSWHTSMESAQLHNSPSSELELD